MEPKDKIFEELIKEFKPFLSKSKRVDYGEKFIHFEYKGRDVEIKLLEKPKRYKCKICGRDKFTKKSPHNCRGGYRKRNIEWEEIKV